MQALVTGAAKRVGRAIALALHGAGYRVAVHYRTSRAEAEATSALLGGAPLIEGDQARDPERIVADAALPHLRAARGSIVTVLDVCGTTQVWKGYAHYTASKAGLAALTRLLALEWAPEVRVNGVAPGTVLPPEGMDSGPLAKRIPLG